MDAATPLPTPEATPDAPDVAAVHDQDDAGERAPKVRRARDPQRRALEAEAEATRRALRKALAQKDAAKLRKLREAATGEGAPATVAERAPADVVQLRPQASAMPPATVTRGPNWPSEVSVESWRNIVAPVVGLVAAGLQGTPYALDGQAEFTIGGQKRVLSKVDALADATSCLLAKYVPDAVNGPEMYAGAVLLGCFGGPILAKALDRLSGAIEARTAALTGAPQGAQG